MERITKRTGKAVWIGRPIQYYNYEDIRGVLERLAAIEDILGDTYDLDHLRELVEADKDGRCVVLPCKVGDKVYWIVDGGVFECFFTIAAAEEVGKTVFLTREAAEAALAKEAE